MEPFLCLCFPNLSQVLQQEREQWQNDHSVPIELHLNQRNEELEDINNLFPINSTIHLCRIEHPILGAPGNRIKYSHWLLVNDASLNASRRLLPDENAAMYEFQNDRGSNVGYDTARVRISRGTKQNLIPMAFARVDDAIWFRMRRILGMTNYSLLLRNCEHVANYVFAGKWISYQTIGTLADLVESKISIPSSARASRNVNPVQSATVASRNVNPVQSATANPQRMFPFTIENEFIFHNRNKSLGRLLDLEDQDFTYVILVLGLPNSGKSYLVNCLLNTKMSWGPDGVGNNTNNELWYAMCGGFLNFNQAFFSAEKVLIINTAAIDEKDWFNEEIYPDKIVKQALKSNKVKYVDLVLVVFKPDELKNDFNVKPIKNYFTG